MWDFEHPPLDAALALRYQIDRMSPAECAARLAARPGSPAQAHLGLVPIAALATTPGLQILPGCTIASKAQVRSLLLVRRAAQPLNKLRSVAADTASRTTVTYARILFHKWANPAVPFLPMSADLDAMLAAADAAILIGDPALLALEERANRFERTHEELVYHDLAEEWRTLTGHPFVSAVWAFTPTKVGAPGPPGSSWTGLRPWGGDPSHLGTGDDLGTGERMSQIAHDLIQSRTHGLQNIDTLVAEWSAKLPIPEATIRTYLTTNIHYILDEECIEGMRVFFRTAAELGILPEYNFPTMDLLRK
jgi:chorismate dehydratase